MDGVDLYNQARLAPNNGASECCDRKGRTEQKQAVRSMRRPLE